MFACTDTGQAAWMKHLSLLVLPSGSRWAWYHSPHLGNGTGPTRAEEPSVCRNLWSGHQRLKFSVWHGSREKVNWPGINDKKSEVLLSVKSVYLGTGDLQNSPVHLNSCSKRSFEHVFPQGPINNAFYQSLVFAETNRSACLLISQHLFMEWTPVLSKPVKWESEIWVECEDLNLGITYKN